MATGRIYRSDKHGGHQELDMTRIQGQDGLLYDMTISASLTRMDPDLYDHDLLRYDKPWAVNSRRFRRIWNAFDFAVEEHLVYAIRQKGGPRESK